MKTYTGIGSRETPQNILDTMHTIGAYLAKKGLVLRSGGANGADSAFENGCNAAEGRKEIFLPWPGFNNSDSDLTFHVKALEIAESILPNWSSLKKPVQNLHARNVCQILGFGLNDVTDFVVCWTKDGKLIGGTRTALIIAQQNNVPIFNLAIDGEIDKLRDFIRKRI